QIQLPPWHMLGEGHQEGWARVVRELEAVIVEAEGMSWLSLARQAHTAFGSPERPYEEEAPATKICWVAAVRHLANMVDWEKEDDQSVENHEGYWKSWVARQLQLHEGQEPCKRAA